MAYPNKTINEGNFGSFQAANALSLYQRVKFNTVQASDQKPQIDVAAIADRGVGIVMQPAAQNAWATIKFLNSPGEQYGLASGTIGIGVSIYTAASGKFSTVSTGGAVLAGVSTCAAYDGGVVTFVPVTAAA